MSACHLSVKIMICRNIPPSCSAAADRKTAMTSPVQPGDHADPTPPWSRPETPVSAPPLGPAPGATGTTPGAPITGRTSSGRTPSPSPTEQGEVKEPRSTGAAVVPASRDRRVWFILGLVALLLSCCCTASVITALAWSVGLFDRLAGPVEQSTRVVTAAHRDGVGGLSTGHDSEEYLFLRVMTDGVASLSRPAVPPGCCWSAGTAPRPRP